MKCEARHATASCALALRLALQSHVIALVGHPGVLDIPDLNKVKLIS